MALPNEVEWSWLPSVGTWFIPRASSRESNSEPMSHETEKLSSLNTFRWNSKLLPDLLKMDWSSKEGTRLLFAIQRAVCTFLSWLTASVRASDSYQAMAQQFEGTNVGQAPMAWWQQELANGASDPNKLKTWVESLSNAGSDSTSSDDSVKYWKGKLNEIGETWSSVVENGAPSSQVQSLRDRCQWLIESDKVQKMVNSDVTKKQIQMIRDRCEAVLESNSERKRQVETLVSEAKALQDKLCTSSTSAESEAGIAEEPSSLDSLSLREDMEHYSSLLESVDEMALRRWETQLTSLVSNDGNALLASIRKEFTEILQDPASQDLFRQLGLDFNLEGHFDSDALLKTFREQIDSGEGRAVLQTIQHWALELLKVLAPWKLDWQRCARRADQVEPALHLFDRSSSLARTCQADADALQKWLFSSALLPAREWPEQNKSLLAKLAYDESCRGDIFDAVVEEIVECILDRLPGIEVPKIEKETGGTEYLIDNIELRKCSVKSAKVTLVLLKPPSRAAAEMRSASHSSSAAAVANKNHPYERRMLSEALSATPNVRNATSRQSQSAQTSTGCARRRAALVWVEKDGFIDVDELIRITIRDIVLRVPNLQWSFHQKTFLRLHGKGSATAQARGLCVVASFGLQRVEIDGKMCPRLGLTSCSVVVDRLKLEIKDSSFSWLYNAIAELCNDVLREYVVSSIERAITQSLSSLVVPLNQKLQPYWSSILSAVGTSIEKLPAAEDVASQSQSGRASGLGLLVLMGGVTCLERADEKPWCQCVSKDKSGKKKMVKETKGRKDIRNPQWNEVHLVPWRKGEVLDFAIFDVGDVGPRELGRRSVPSNWFFPHGFDGELPLDGLHESRLRIHVAPVMQDEITIELYRRPSDPLGLTFDVSTLAVESSDPSGLLAARFSEQHPARHPLGLGDFVARVATREGWIVGSGRDSNRERAIALEREALAAIVVRRISGGGFAFQPKILRSC